MNAGGASPTLGSMSELDEVLAAWPGAGDVRDQAAAEIARLRAIEAAALAFVAKYDVCMPYVDDMTFARAIRGERYVGPRWADEIEALRRSSGAPDAPPNDPCRPYGWARMEFSFGEPSVQP